MPTRPLTQEEVKMVTECLFGIRNKCLFITGLRSGFRISELLSLTWNDVQGNTITVQRRNMKGKTKSRTVPMHPQVKGYLAQYLNLVGDLNPFLFPISRIQAWRILTAAYAKAGLQGKLGTHCMRKTLAQRVYTNSGKDLALTQKALGHASISSTQHYLSVDQGMVDQAILEA